LRRVFSETRPLAGGGSFTPDRRAFESPMAMACLADRAPCLPSRMWCISSRTNSPACVLADFPCRLSLLARSIVALSGMTYPPPTKMDAIVSMQDGVNQKKADVADGGVGKPRGSFESWCFCDGVSGLGFMSLFVSLHHQVCKSPD